MMNCIVMNYLSIINFFADNDLKVLNYTKT